MDKVLQQIIEFLRGLTVRQRVFLAGSVVLVAGTIWIFVRLLGDGDYRTLYSGMAGADAQSLAQRLTAPRCWFVRTNSIRRALKLPPKGRWPAGGWASNFLTNPTGRAAIFRRK